MCLYLLHAVLPILAELSLIFQTGDLNFSQIPASLQICRNRIGEVSQTGSASATLENEWQKYVPFLNGDHRTLSKDDICFMDGLTWEYCTALLQSLRHRFPEPEVLGAFSIFDHHLLPQKLEDRKAFGNDMLNILLNKFSSLLEDKDRAVINYQSLKERLVSLEFKHCENAAAVCTIMLKNSIYRQMFPDLYQLATIALTIPLATAWPERGFSTLARIKTKSRNRLLDGTLCSLINVSMNGPEELTDEAAHNIAKKWIDRKNRRKVTERAIAQVSQQEQSDDNYMSEFDLGEDFETFYL